MKITRRLGIWLIIAGIAFQFINIITYGLWNIDIDVWGALIAIVGVVIVIVKRKNLNTQNTEGEKE